MKDCYRPGYPEYPRPNYPQPPFPHPRKCPPFDNCVTVEQQIRCLYNMIKDLADGQGLTLDDTVTATSENGVKSSGIWTYGEGIRSSLEGQVDALDTEVTANIQDIHNLQMWQQEQAQKVQSLEVDVSALETSQVAQDQKIQANTDELNQQMQDIADINTKDANQDTEIGALETRVTNLEGQEVALDDTVTEASTNGVKSSGIWTYGEGIRTEAQDGINTAEEAILHLGERVTTAEGEIAEQDTKITDVQNALLGKQDALTFDTISVSDSSVRVPRSRAVYDEFKNYVALSDLRNKFGHTLGLYAVAVGFGANYGDTKLFPGYYDTSTYDIPGSVDFPSDGTLEITTEQNEYFIFPDKLITNIADLTYNVPIVIGIGDVATNGTSAIITLVGQRSPTSNERMLIKSVRINLYTLSDFIRQQILDAYNAGARTGSIRIIG